MNGIILNNCSVVIILSSFIQCSSLIMWLFFLKQNKKEIHCILLFNYIDCIEIRKRHVHIYYVKLTHTHMIYTMYKTELDLTMG